MNNKTFSFIIFFIKTKVLVYQYTTKWPNHGEKPHLKSGNNLMFYSTYFSSDLGLKKYKTLNMSVKNWPFKRVKFCHAVFTLFCVMCTKCSIFWSPEVLFTLKPHASPWLNNRHCWRTHQPLKSCRPLSGKWRNPLWVFQPV